MTRRLYLMRHGYTLFNLLDKKQGWCDSPLTEVGVTQARQAGEHFRELGISFDHAYSSPSERAWRSLELALGEDYPFVLDKRLREWCFGVLEGHDNYVSPRPASGDFFVRFGGESEEQVLARFMPAVDEIMRRPGHENVLIVSHGATTRLFFREWQEHSHIEGGGQIKNCGVYTYEFDEATGFFSCVDCWSPALQTESKIMTDFPEFPA